MKSPVWLLGEAVLGFHDISLAQFGGADRIRDFSLFQSAMARPQNLFTYGKSTLAEMAAAYAGGIITNHPFIDGNKRTGFLAAVVFLELNGMTFHASEAEAALMTMDLAAGKITERQYSDWLEKNSS